MTKLIERTGDLFTSTAPALGHGCNVRGKMGAGIAVQFRRRWPDMYAEYRRRCWSRDLQQLLRPGDVFTWSPKPGRYVYNIASQREPGRDARLDWLHSGVAAALDHAADHDVHTIALPQIGCGIGGLRWPDVRETLAELAAAGPVDIEVWEYAA